MLSGIVLQAVPSAMMMRPPPLKRREPSYEDDQADTNSERGYDPCHKDVKSSNMNGIPRKEITKENNYRCYADNQDLMEKQCLFDSEGPPIEPNSKSVFQKNEQSLLGAKQNNQTRCGVKYKTKHKPKLFGFSEYYSLILNRMYVLATLGVALAYSAGVVVYIFLPYHIHVQLGLTLEDQSVSAISVLGFGDLCGRLVAGVAGTDINYITLYTIRYFQLSKVGCTF